MRTPQMTTVTRVLSSQPPTEITTETRGPLTRIVTCRTFQQVDGGTEGRTGQPYQMPLMGILSLLIFRSEHDWYATESVRRMREYLQSLES